MAQLLTRLLQLMLAVLSCAAVSGLFEWLTQTPTPPPPPPPAPAPLLKDAQFELATADEKFLAEAKQLELSALDSCHYRVVAQLKASCDGLSEENLAKLGVVLFNCQAEIEGRRSFPCTEDMSIKECTADMDPDTWNAYHIVSNRARSVCYATRQQLFRRRAEHTVNALISTVTCQLSAMKDLKEGQVELKELTAASLDKLMEGHSALQAQQDKLHEGQEQMESSLRENLERLGQEKALIASGQQLVARLIQDITKRMDHSMSEFLQYQEQTSQYYAELMTKLERMNSTLGFMLHYLDTMDSRIEDRLRLIQGYLGWAGLSLTAMWTCVAHTGYFVLCAVLLAFLRSSGFSRAMLLLTVPLNAAAEVNQQPALDLPSLSLLLLTASLGHWFVKRLLEGFKMRAKQTTPPPLMLGNIMEPHDKPESTGHKHPHSSTPERDERDNFLEDDLLNQDSFLSGNLGISAVSHPRKTTALESRFLPTVSQNHSTPRFVPQPVFSQARIDDIPLKDLGGIFDEVHGSHGFGSDSRSSSPVPSLVSNSSLSGRQLCNGITKTGKPCKKRAILRQEFCRVHEGGYTSYVKF